MRFLRVIPLLLTITVIWLLDQPISTLPALGRIIDPVNGALAAAEPVNQDFNKSLHLTGLSAPVSIWLEDRLVPHIRAQNEHDLYYAQGYIHAYFRLWQMDLQTRAAGGRVSEVVGPRAITFDRGQRRKGMVWAAERSLKTMEHDSRTKAMLDAYRDGINTYIHTLGYRSLPIEYKLMGFCPEDWTNVRTALLMKYMADDLSGKTDDIAFTILRDQLGQEQFDFLFPEKIKGSKPVIPEGTPFAKPSLPIPKYPGDSVWAHFSALPASRGGGGGIGKGIGKIVSNTVPDTSSQHHLPPPGEGRDGGASGHDETAKGSNNWAISGKHTASGKPILCNDPHLALNLPSLWFEMQLTAPGINVYGASLPGAPGIVIGFNQKISWGFTNNYRDVKDFYEITPVRSLSEAEAVTPMLPSAPLRERSGVLLSPVAWIRPAAYLFCGESVPFRKSGEVIKVKGEPDVIDTVLYTLHGPVNFDPSFPDTAHSGKLLACTWMGHRGSNELLATYLLNRAEDYATFTDAIQHFECPAQNIAYADGTGNIAMWGQGRFINKWKGQGKYVMEGRDSLTLWGADIPMSENPHVLNPQQGYVASANQSVTDSTYPYWYNGMFTEWRSWEINDILKKLDDSTYFPSYAVPIYDSTVVIWSEGPQPIIQERTQNDEGSYLWQHLAVLLEKMKSDRRKVSNIWIVEDWYGFYDLMSTSSATTEFQILWYFIYRDIWKDEFSEGISKYPSQELTMELFLNDSTSKYLDDKRTQKIETRADIYDLAFQQTTDSIDKIKPNVEWYKVKNTTLAHLAKIPAFSYDHLKIGGWSNTINACTGTNGPSWRMIVEMDSIPKAYAVYPGGQSGNPGSPHYSDFIDHWVEGKYFNLQFLTTAITKKSIPIHLDTHAVIISPSHVIARNDFAKHWSDETTCTSYNDLMCRLLQPALSEAEGLPGLLLAMTQGKNHNNASPPHYTNHRHNSCHYRMVFPLVDGGGCRVHHRVCRKARPGKGFPGGLLRHSAALAGLCTVS